jgi:hypothetical protein
MTFNNHAGSVSSRFAIACNSAQNLDQVLARADVLGLDAGDHSQ